MIPSVKDRKENANKFGLCYEDICKMQNRMPLLTLKVHLKKNILDFHADRITYDEWGPILNALSLDRSLHFIGIRSASSDKMALEDVVSETKVKLLQRQPVIRTRYMLMMLMKALKMCMCNSNTLTCMELEGLPLASDYLSELIEGITSCESLQNISFHRSLIGDEGCRLLCLALRDLSNIISIDLSNCGLTDKGALAVAELVKYQKIQRYSESWKHTLRYREPDLDTLPGLRRITLNHNEELGDGGILHLVDVAKDDLFLKALDLQNCGISDISGNAVLEMLQCNASLAIVDLRANHNLSSALLKQIMVQLYNNNQDSPQQYHWIAVDRFQLPSKPVKLRPKSQPLMRKVSSVQFETRSAPAAFLTKRCKTGVPWRISARLDRRRECMETSPGTPRSVQYQEPYPPYHVADTHPPNPRYMELEKAKLQLLWLSNRLESEVMKRKQVEEEKMALQQRLDEVLREDCVLVEKQTMASIQQSFHDFQDLVQKLKNTGLSGLLDQDVLDSLDKMDTDDKGRLAFLIKKSYSANMMRDKSNQTELHKVSKSASTFRNVGQPELYVETGVGDMGQRELLKDDNLIVSSEGTAGTLTYQDCSSDSVGASGEDSEVLLPRDQMSSSRRLHGKKQRRVKQKVWGDANNILYQTVVRKNQLMDVIPLELPKDTLLHQKGSTSTSSTSIPEDLGSFHTDDDLF